MLKISHGSSGKGFKIWPNQPSEIRHFIAWQHREGLISFCAFHGPKNWNSQCSHARKGRSKTPSKRPSAACLPPPWRHVSTAIAALAFPKCDDRKAKERCSRGLDSRPSSPRFKLAGGDLQIPAPIYRRIFFPRPSMTLREKRFPRPYIALEAN